MKIVIFGHQTIGCVCLDVLLEAQQEIVGVVTDKSDRETAGGFDSLDARARERGLFRLAFDATGQADLANALQARQPELLLACAFPHQLGHDLLSMPHRRSVVLHNGLYPAHLDQTPHIWAVHQGALTSGITLFSVTPGTAGLLAQESVPIAWNDTSFDLYRKQSAVAAELLRRTLPAILAGEGQPLPLETSPITTHGPLRPDDCAIDWHRSGRDLYNLVRAVTHPYPGATTEFRGCRCTIWRADTRPSPLLKNLPPPGTIARLAPLHVMTGEGLLIVRRLQREGDIELEAEAFVRQHRVTPGERFTA